MFSFKRWFSKSKGPEIFFIGLPKTGSTSVAGLIRKNEYCHEFEHDRFSTHLYQFKNDLIDEQKYKTYLDERIGRIPYGYDIATFNYLYVAHLYKHFPDAKFLLPLRDVGSWANSFINHIRADIHLYGGNDDWHNMLGKALLGDWFDKKIFLDEETVLKQLDTIIPNVCKFWNEGIVACLRSFPQHKLLVYRYSLLSQDLAFFKDFVKLSDEELRLDHHHNNQAYFHTDFVGARKKLFEDSCALYCKEAYELLHKEGIDKISDFTYKIL